MRKSKDAWDKHGAEESQIMFREGTARGKLQKQELQWVLSEIANCGEKLKILDAGCGPGRYLKPLIEMHNQVIGCDFSSSMVRLVRENLSSLNPVVVQGDIQQLPFEDGQFNIVLMLDVLHHLETREMRARAVAEAFRVSNHYVFVDVKNKLNPILWYRYKKQSDAFPRTAYTYGEIKDLIKENGGNICESLGLMLPLKLFAPYILVKASKV